MRLSYIISALFVSVVCGSPAWPYTTTKAVTTTTKATTTAKSTTTSTKAISTTKVITTTAVTTTKSTTTTTTTTTTKPVTTTSSTTKSTTTVATTVSKTTTTTSSTYISADRKTFTLIFDNYVAALGPGVSITESRKNCQLNIDIHYPQVGPKDENYLIHDELTSTSVVWSPCGEAGALNINSQISLRTSITGSSGLMTTDSEDGKFTYIMGLQWAQCP
ncbi:hypothetical protein ABW20_dc0103947 [Dactylellina cionopaga]|nr:hypothetical protein ABW20_dc0103947 [Dactylellina cionopaga]